MESTFEFDQTTSISNEGFKFWEGLHYFLSDRAVPRKSPLRSHSAYPFIFCLILSSTTTCGNFNVTLLNQQLYLVLLIQKHKIMTYIFGLSKKWEIRKKTRLKLQSKGVSYWNKNLYSFLFFILERCVLYLVSFSVAHIKMLSGAEPNAAIDMHYTD